MYALFVSYNCGMYYKEEDKVETLEEIQPKLDKLDKDLLRWYLEKDGKQCLEVTCALHKKMFNFLIKKNL
jgi:hypothetical protein